jgi:hypothetical protein
MNLYKKDLLINSFVTKIKVPIFNNRIICDYERKF